MTDRFTEPLVDALRHIHVFETLDEAQRQWLADRMEEAVYEAGAARCSRPEPWPSTWARCLPARSTS